MTINNESDGYNFVIIILAGTISLLYSSYNYIQTTALDIYEYIIFCGSVSLAIIILIAYFIYFIIKGLSMEVQDDNYEKLKSIATKIYLINIIIFIYYIIILCSTFSILAISPYEDPFINMLFTLVILMIFILFLFISIKKKYVPIAYTSIVSLLQILGISIKNLLKILFFVIFLWAILLFITHSFYLGNIELEMDKIYYKSDEPIPALFEVTGLDSYFEITLFNVSSNNLTEIRKINNIGPVYYKDFKETAFISNDLLVVSSLGNGKYNIFINTTNLTPGYNQLKCSQQHFGKVSEASSDASGFYILDYKNESFDGLIN